MADTNITTNVGPISSAGDAKLDALSRSDDASDYIAERQAQDAEDAGQQLVETPAEARQNKIEAALAEARERTKKAQDQSNNLDAEYSRAEQEWLAQQAQEQQLERCRSGLEVGAGCLVRYSNALRRSRRR
jgi:hypothetical protein